MTSPNWYKNYPAGVQPCIEIKEKTMVDVFYETVSTYPDQVAVVYEEESLTYQQLQDAVHQVANGLREFDVQKGDRVALMMSNSKDYIVSYYALLVSGAIVVQNNPMYTERELYYQINNSQAKKIIIDEELVGKFPSICTETLIQDVIIANTNNVKPQSLQSFYKEQSIKFQRPLINPIEDTAVLQYTGGTTGLSKGVMLTHYNIYANVIQTHSYLGVLSQEGKERLLNVLPLFHVYGMTVSMNYMIYLKSTLYILKRFTSTETLSIIQQHQITMFPGTPTIYVAVNNDENIRKYNLNSIHTCISGSAPLPIEVKREFELITGAKVVDAYGLSEASPVVHSNPINGVRKPGSIGMPVPNTQCKVVDLDKGERELPIGEPGELLIKGPQVMKGYWGMPKETEDTLKNGWLYTGDIAYQDEDGYFFIVSRKKDVIIAGGYNIYPREVEEVIFEHPAVREVVVIGVLDSYRGETVKALVVLKEEYTLTSEEIVSFCLERLAKYKIPKQIEFRDEIPKTAVGKILRRKLVEEELRKIEELSN